MLCQKLRIEISILINPVSAFRPLSYPAADISARYRLYRKLRIEISFLINPLSRCDSFDKAALTSMLCRKLRIKISILINSLSPLRPLSYPAADISARYRLCRKLRIEISFLINPLSPLRPIWPN